MKKGSFTIERMESQIINILNHTMKFVIYDQDIKLSSFTYVRIDPAFTFCKIYVDTFKRADIDKIVEKLNFSKAVFKKELAKNLNIRRVPDIRFYKDDTIIA